MARRYHIHSEKVQIGHEIQQAEGVLLPGQELNYRELGRVCRVDKNIVAKIHNELEEYVRVRFASSKSLSNSTLASVNAP